MEALNQTQINAMKQGIRAEEQRRKESGEAPLTPYEKHQMEMGYMNDAADTSAAEDNISQIGNIRTSPKRGSVVISGSYKGMHPRAAERAAMTGQVPVKGGRPGQVGNGLLDEFYAKNPHLNRRSIVDFVTGKSPTPAAPASPPINMASPYGIVAGVVQTAAQNALKEKTTAETNAAMAQGIHDGKQGVVERGPRSVVWNNGATVMTGASGNKTLTSPYGSGSSSVRPAASVVVTPSKPAQVPFQPGVTPRPTDLQRQIDAARSAGAVQPTNVPLRPGVPGGSGVMAGVNAASFDAINQTNRQLPANAGASVVIGRLQAGQPVLPVPGSSPRPSVLVNQATASRTDPVARTANTMQPPQGPVRPSVLVTGPTANPATMTPRTDATPMAPGDRAKIASIAGDQGLWYRNVWPAVTGQFGTDSKAAPVLDKYGVSVPSQYPNPAARVAGDNEAVLDLEKQGVLTGKTTKDAGGVPRKSITVHTPQALIPKNQPGSMQQRTMSPPRSSVLVTPIRL